MSTRWRSSLTAPAAGIRVLCRSICALPRLDQHRYQIHALSANFSGLAYPPPLSFDVSLVHDAFTWLGWHFGPARRRATLAHVRSLGSLFGSEPPERHVRHSGVTRGVVLRGACCWRQRMPMPHESNGQRWEGTLELEAAVQSNRFPGPLQELIQLHTSQQRSALIPLAFCFLHCVSLHFAFLSHRGSLVGR